MNVHEIVLLRMSLKVRSYECRQVRSFA